MEEGAYVRGKEALVAVSGTDDDDFQVEGGAWRNHPTYGELFMEGAAAADEDDNEDDDVAEEQNAGAKSTLVAAVLASEAAMDRKLVGGACRKDPTYGEFLLLPPRRRELSKQVACRRSVTTLGVVEYRVRVGVRR